MSRFYLTFALFFVISVSLAHASKNCFSQQLSNLFGASNSEKLVLKKFEDWEPSKFSKIKDHPDHYFLIDALTNSGMKKNTVGKISIVNIGKENIIVVHTPSGKIHVLDANQINDVKLGPTTISPDDLHVLFMRKEPEILYLKNKNLRKYLCHLKSDSESHKMFNLIKSRVHLNQASVLMQAENCALAFMATVPAGLIVYSAEYVKPNETKKQDWFHLHSTNFVEGLSYMAIMHQCLQALSPRQKSAVLAATLGVNIAGNVWEEIDIPNVKQKSLPLFFTQGQDRNYTDWDDFASGMYATATYLAISKLYENYPVWAANFCK